MKNKEKEKLQKMTKLNIEIGGSLDEYKGSKVFASLADVIGLSVDLVCFKQ